MSPTAKLIAITAVAIVGSDKLGSLIFADNDKDGEKLVKRLAVGCLVAFGASKVIK